MSVGRSRTVGEKEKAGVHNPPQLYHPPPLLPLLAPKGRILLAQPAAYCRNNLEISDQDAPDLVSCLRSGILFSRNDRSILFLFFPRDPSRDLRESGESFGETFVKFFSFVLPDTRSLV